MCWSNDGMPHKMVRAVILHAAAQSGDSHKMMGRYRAKRSNLRRVNTIGTPQKNRGVRSPVFSVSTNADFSTAHPEKIKLEVMNDLCGLYIFAIYS